jgi:hypothetical protein
VSFESSPNLLTYIAAQSLVLKNMLSVGDGYATQVNNFIYMICKSVLPLPKSKQTLLLRGWLDTRMSFTEEHPSVFRPLATCCRHVIESVDG